MKKTIKPPSRLVAAAEALEAELERIGTIAREANRSPLDSSRNLDLTGKKLTELGAENVKLQPLVTGLLEAVKELVDAQQLQAENITARVAELSARRATFQQLMEQEMRLAVAARELNQLVSAYAEARRNGAVAQTSDSPTMATIQSTMSELIENARQLALTAKNENFKDIAGHADGLAKQVQASRHKLELLTAGSKSAGTVN